MHLLRAAADRTVPAPAAAVYALLADYRDGHHRILPPAFTDLMVLQGGIGAGTIIRFALKFAGRKQVLEARVEEPEPGRVLSEAYPEQKRRHPVHCRPSGGSEPRPDRDLLGTEPRTRRTDRAAHRAAAVPQALYRGARSHRALGSRQGVEWSASGVVSFRVRRRGISSLFHRRPDGTRYFSPRLDTHATVNRTTPTRDRCGSPKIPLLVHECQDGDVARGRKPTLEGDRYRASSRRRSLFGSKRCARSGSNPNQRRSPISAG